MFFGAYIGGEENPLAWKESMHRHAAWLGLSSYIESYRLDESQNLFFGWLRAKPLDVKLHRELGGYLIINTSDSMIQSEHATVPTKLWQTPAEGINVNVIQFLISLAAGELRIVIPPATPEPFYYAKSPQGYFFGNDIRLLLRLTGLELDERAIYALFQYGAIPPPITMSKNIRRIPNGHVLRVIPRLEAISLEAFFKPVTESEITGLSPEVRVKETLDNILANVPLSTAIHFSGGVDSGLLAARLSEMGRTDIKLINYAFGPEDPAGHQAVHMASHLGFTCEQIMYDPSGLSSVLERLGRDYSFPFGDASAITQNLLVHTSLQSAERPPVILNGTGADLAFGTLENARWSRIALTPVLLRQMIAKGYLWLDCWKYDSKIETYARHYLQSLKLPLQHASILASNSLDGSAYVIPAKIRKGLQETIEALTQTSGLGLEPNKQASLISLVFRCPCRAAACSFDPLRRLGIKLIYPFLEPSMVHLSLSLRQDKDGREEDKALLKKLLAYRVPSELVYRPKNYFFPPLQEILTYAPMQKLLSDLTLSKQNPLIDFCRADTIQQMVERVRYRQSLSQPACRFLWVLTFTSTWLSQLEFR
jgi:asparagine synthase (glutamine-hydrolysing)